MLFEDIFYDKQIPIEPVDTIAGVLYHVAFVYDYGSHHLPALTSFRSELAAEKQWVQDEVGLYAPHSFHTEIKWWQNELGRTPELHRGIRSLRILPLRTADIWVDASTGTGIGVVIGNEALAYKWSPVLKYADPEDQVKIGWGEAAAAEIAVRVLVARGFHDCRVVIYGDNEGVAAAFKRRRCRNWPINKCIRRADEIARAVHLDFDIEWVPSAKNRSDPVSRGVFEGFVPMHLDSDLGLPEELTRALTVVSVPPPR